MMNQRITILPPLLANQLAAGEVIERPSSIVKELVENSLDAGSTELTILLELGGTKRIVVTDNGSGIHPEDLSLAFARHATSKIKAASDLSQIASLGFRGEALASIGSVAKLRIASAWGNEPAHEAKIAASQEASIQLCAHPRGTTVEVLDLFYNTPARKKFLKSPRTEWLHIDDLIKRLSLSRPDVSWHIYHDGKLVTRYIAKPRDIRLQQVLGKSFMEAGLPIDAAITQVRLSGMIARPEFARSSNDYQFFYVNGRMVKDRVISHAIRLAYDEEIYPGRYPAYVLYCDLDHSLVDVNVHPTKHEVRFVHARMVHDFISETLLNTLQSVFASPHGRDGLTHQCSELTHQRRDELTHQCRGGLTHQRRDELTHQRRDGLTHQRRGGLTHQCRGGLTPQAYPPSAQLQPPSAQRSRASTEGGLIPGQAPAYPLGQEIASHLPFGKVIACLGNRVVITQQNELLYAFDWQKTLQCYARARWEAGLSAQTLAIMPLLEPLLVTKSDNEDLMDALQAIGFELQATHATHFVIRAIPACLQGINLERLAVVLAQSSADLMIAIIKIWALSRSFAHRDVELLLAEIIAMGDEAVLVYKRHAPETLLA